MTLLDVSAVAATGFFTDAWLMIAIPLLAAAVLLLAGRFANKIGSVVGVAGVAGSFVVALVLFIQLLGRTEASRAVNCNVFEWLHVGNWSLEIGLLVDQLSILFALLVTGVGTLIFVYSIGYMADDPGRRRFFGFMNLFVAAMLILVLANNYVMLFIGWEGVGLSSYLLIGFWQQRQSAALAAKKAFLVNKIGDLGLIAAIAIMLSQFGSVNFSDVNAGVGGASSLWINLLGFALLLAACGKSAQVPLQSWLLDAMEGPTPVSALIHAATMVTAGVYLVIRSHAVFELSAAATLAVAIVGLVTIFAGAWIGASKDDIKKVLAGSTMSQIGYMMLAAGIGPAGAAFAIFHLLTHGAFKANLFLGAGTVMHAMDDDTNMRHFGALAKVMPWTFVSFAAATLALIGFPFTGGYYSKEHIITAAFDKSMVFGVLAVLGAGLTAFYMMRLIMFTFVGTKRWPAAVKPHEARPVMVVPLVVLAVISLGIGMALNGWIQDWLAAPTGHLVHETHLVEFGWQTLTTLGVVLIGLLAGFLAFRKPESVTEGAPQTMLVKVGANELYANQFNDTVIVRPGAALANGVAAFDTYIVDGAYRGLGKLARSASTVLRNLQSGNVRTYALTMVAGVVLVGVGLAIGLWV